jgi:hypothetical protein
MSLLVEADISSAKAASRFDPLTYRVAPILAEILQASCGRRSGVKKPGKLDRIARLESEAGRLAQSGNYQGFASIQAALLERGFAEAASSTLFQNSLDLLRTGSPL